MINQQVIADCLKGNVGVGEGAVNMAKIKVIAAVFLGLLSALSVNVVAKADLNVKNYQFAPDAYKDLPGVKDPGDLAKLPDDYSCETVMVPTRNPEGRYRDVFGRRGLPTTGYKCTTSDGYTYFGTVHPKARNNRPQIEPYSPL
jgi:hypothetical protein